MPIVGSDELKERCPICKKYSCPLASRITGDKIYRRMEELGLDHTGRKKTSIIKRGMVDEN